MISLYGGSEIPKIIFQSVVDCETLNGVRERGAVVFKWKGFVVDDLSF